MATQPCPCGWRSHPERICRCSPIQIDRYLSRVSGPLLDRIDLHIEVASVKFQELSGARSGEYSRDIRKRVEKARNIQLERFNQPEKNDEPGDQITRIKASKVTMSNAQMSSQAIRKYCRIDEHSMQLMELAMKKLGLSARAYDRILKVSRTIADLDEQADIKSNHIAEAIQYRSLDRNHLLQVA